MTGCRREFSRRWRSLNFTGAALLVFVLFLTSCGGDNATSTEDGDGSTETSVAEVDEPEVDEPEEPREIVLGMSTSSIAVPGPWVADILGYYEEEGLDIQISPTSGAIEAVQQAVTGQYDFVYASASNVLKGMDEHEAVFAPTLNVFYENFQIWIVPEGSPLESTDDLAGTTIGITSPGAGEVPMMEYVLSRNGLDPDSDVEVVAVGDEPATIVQALEQGRIDSVTHSLVLTASLQAQGYEFRSILPEDLEEGGADGIWAVGDDVVGDRELMAKFARATAKGTLFCLSNLDACLDVIGQEYPERVEDREVATSILEAFFPPLTPPEEDGQLQFGPMTLENLTKVADIYGQVEGPTGLRDPDSVVAQLEADTITDQEFISEINDFNYEAIVNQAESY